VSAGAYTWSAADGQPVYLKFQSFNVFGGGLQDLSSCTAYSFSPGGGGSSDPIAIQLQSGLPTDLGQINVAPSVADDFESIFGGAVTASIDLGSLA
jgi:hypothetical protein